MTKCLIQILNIVLNPFKIEVINEIIQNYLNLIS